MSNFYMDSKSIRKIINDALDGKYKSGFPIVKELIQNANDAQASCLHMGWCRGIKNADHPLLKNVPGIFVVNDGLFTFKDSLAIRRIWSNFKDGDAATIGKFGLGLKSVFHLCDAFFYFASGVEGNQNGDRNRFDILNPWEDDDPEKNFHQDWKEPHDSDYEKVKNFLSENGLITEMERWFCVWIPLRSKKISGNHYLIDTFPGEKAEPPRDEFFQDDLEISVSQILPLLSSLRKVVCWIEKDGEVRQEFRVERKCTTLRNGRELISDKETEKIFSGKIPESSLAYTGIDRISDDKELQRFYESGDWPRNDEKKKEPAFQHSAACFMKYPSGNQKPILSINRAVFLPLTDMKEEIPLEGIAETGFNLTLHGWYFIDSGRQRIDFKTENTSDNPTKKLRMEWNKLLTEKCNLPLLIPALEKFNEQQRLSEAEMLSLTKAIRQSDIFHKWKDAICREYQWISRISVHNGQYVEQWVKIPSDKTVFSVPNAVKNIQQKLTDSFADLNFLFQKYAVTFEKNALLSVSPCKGISDWPEEMAARFRSFLFSLFRDYSWTNLRQIRDDISQIIRSVPHKDRICIDLPNDFPDSLLQPLFSRNLSLSQLYVPKEFDLIPPDAGQGKILSEDALKILEHIHSQYQSNPDKRYSRIALWVVKNLHTDSKTEVLQGSRNIRLFKGKDYQQGKDCIFSWQELHALNNSRQLFRGNPAFLQNLQSALINHKIVYLDNATSEALFENRVEENANAAFCIRFLLSIPEISADINKRLPLLSQLISRPESISANDYNRAIRYLIHGKRQYFNNTELLYVDEHNDVWAKILRNILKTKGEDWKIIERAIAAPVYSKWNELGIKQINKEVTERELEKISNPKNLDFSFLLFQEREKVIEEIQNIRLLKNLPIFEDMNGNFRHIDENTYLHTNFFLPAGLQTPIRLIKRTPAIERKSLAPCLNAENAITLILEEDNPSVYWEYIMENLGKADKIHEQKLINFLKERHWIPLQNGKSVSPAKILHIPDLQEDILKIVRLSHDYFAISDVKDEFVRHSAFAKLSEMQLFIDTDNVLWNLGKILSDESKFCIVKSDRFQITDFAEIFQGIPDETMPVFPFVNNFLKKLSPDKVQSFFIPPLQQDSIESQRIQNTLNFLSGKHEKSKENIRKKIFEFFTGYLKIAVTKNDFGNILRNIRLLNCKNKWKQSRYLSVYLNNIEPEYIVDSRLESIISDNVKLLFSSNQKDTEFEKEIVGVNLRKHANFLEEYFNNWENLVSSDLIGAFICLLGNDSNFLRLSKKFFKNSSIREVRDHLRDSFSRSGKNINQVMETTRCYLLKKGKSENSVQINNLFGDLFTVSLVHQISSLFAGNFEKNGMNFKIYILSLDISNMDGEKLKNILCETIRELCQNLYGVKIENDHFLDDLAKTDQLDIWIAKRLISENAIITLHQLGIGFQHGEIRKKLKAWDNLRRRSVLIRNNSRSTEMDKQIIEKDKEQLINDVEKMIKNDKEVQKSLLQSVRKKIDVFQYGPDSVLFELFQNADDAVTELKEKMGITPERNDFVVNFQNNSLMRIMHWGREINRNRGRNLTSEQGQDLGYDRDLEKMLILNASDKADEENFVTGKFGLGFKSVFLVTDKPKILSGRLCFCIVGGIYPKFLKKNGYIRLKQYMGDTRCGTVFELPLNCAKSDVLNRFQQLAHILVIFSRSIRQICIDDRTTAWSESAIRPFENIPEISVGSISPLSGGQMEPALLFDFKEEGKLLFLMNPEGFNIFPKNSIPSIWVTNPTREYANLGFLINADFDLDIGRSRLPANSQRNTEKARKIGQKFKEVFTALYDESEKDWTGFCERLKINPKGKYEFWHSVFEVLTHNLKKTVNENDNAILLAKEMLLQENYGYLGLVRHKPVLPNGLWGSDKCLTSFGNIRFRLRGMMDQEKVFSPVSDWQSFREQVKPEQLVSSEIISKFPIPESDIKKMIPFDELDFYQAIRWELKESFDISPEKAVNMGKVFSKDIPLQKEQLANLFKEFRFRTRSGNWCNSSEIIISSETLRNDKDRKDELLRAAFAPDHLILHKDYHKTDALDFVILCRQRLNAPAKVMAEWAEKADSPEKRNAVFRYLLQGELNDFSSELHKIIKNTNGWLKDIRINTIHSVLLYGFNEDEKRKILRILNFGILYENDEAKTGNVSTPQAPLNPVRELEKISDWWQQNQKTYIEKYQNEVYPYFADIASLNGNFDDFNNRKNWMILFLLGTFHTLGRIRTFQNRSFIQNCQNNGWLDIFSGTNSKPDDWIGILEQYIERQDYSEDYQNWMRMFPNIYKLSRYMEDYARNFLDLKYCNDDFSLETILRPLTNFNSNSNAKSAVKTFSIGANFIIRELVRFGVINGNEFIYKHCFVPSYQIREFFISLGCNDLVSEQKEIGDAKVIYEFVKEKLGKDRATFNLCFDIAITQYIRENR